jgi:hypothetical protein
MINQVTRFNTAFPVPRHSHSANYDIEGNKLYIFGGYNLDDPYYLNDLCILNLNKYPNVVFDSIKTIGISPRCRQATFINNRTLYIYGGIGYNKVHKEKVLNDFYAIDLDTELTVEIQYKGGLDFKGKLFRTTYMRLNDYGFFDDNLSRFFIYNIPLVTFTKVNISYGNICERDYYTLNTLLDERIILFGGSYNHKCFGDCNILVSYYLLNDEQWGWYNIDLFGIIS